MRRAIALSLLLVACNASHGPTDAGSMDARVPRDGALAPLGRCASHCSWDDSCPLEPPEPGTACPTRLAYCAYCRDPSAGFDEVTVACRDGRWQGAACGCPCP